MLGALGDTAMCRQAASQVAEDSNPLLQREDSDSTWLSHWEFQGCDVPQAGDGYPFCVQIESSGVSTCLACLDCLDAVSLTTPSLRSSDLPKP